MPARLNLAQRVRSYFAEPAPEPAAPGEIAIADTRRWTWRDVQSQIQPYNPDTLAQRKGGLRIYDEMRCDDQVKACLWLTKAAIMGPGWKLEPVGDADNETALAEDLTAALNQMPYAPLDDALWELLTCLDYGFAVSEKVYDFGEDGGLTIVGVKGRAPHDVEFKQDAFGNLLAIQQRQGGDTPDMDPARFVLFVNQPEFGNLYGRSILREGYRPYWFKTNVQQWWGMFLEKLGIPPIVATHKGPASTIIDAVLAKLRRLQGGAAVAVDDNWTIATLETQRDPKGTFESAIDHYNAAIARSCLLFDKSGVSGKGAAGGSYSLAETQFDTWLMVIGMWRRRFEQTLQAQLIDELAELRAPGVEPPRFAFLPLTQDNKEAIVGAWNALVTSGAVLPELEDENHARRLLKFPERTASADMPHPPARQQAEIAQQAAEDASAAAQKALTDPTPKPGDKAAMMAEGEYWRPLTHPEVRADLDEKRRLFDDLTARYGAELAQATRAIVLDLKHRADRLPETAAAVRNLKVSPKVEAGFRRVADAMLREAYAKGQASGAMEVRRAGAMHRFSERQEAVLAQFASRGGLIGSRAAQFFANKAVWITGLALDDIVKRAQTVLFNSLKQDKTKGQVLYELDQAVADYLPELDSAGRVVNVPARIETIARTNLAEAVNEGRWSSFVDPELEGFISMVRYSAVMDDRTRSRHAHWDGVTLPVNHPAWFGPPDNRPINGFQCRCVLVPISMADGVEPTPDSEIPREPAADPGFK
jgi:hypothetical protein